VTAWQAIFLGLVQGATEFLPISSSGHLVLVPWLLGWQPPDVFFDAVLHLGTLLAVLIYFWRDLFALALAWLGTLRRRGIKTGMERLAWLILLATIPAALAGVLLEGWFESMFGSPRLVAVLLLVTGALLCLAERRGGRRRRAEEANVRDALTIGIAQVLAIAPGISRSGATMSAGLWRGISRPEAARLSFLLAVPVVGAAGLLSLLKTTANGSAADIQLSLLGAAVAALAGTVAIHGLLRFVRAHSLALFSYYCWLFGGLCLIIALLRG